MHFAQPTFLIVAVALAVTLSLLFVRQAVARRHALARLGSPHLVRQLTESVSVPRRRLREFLVVAGVALVAIALARPQWGFRWEEAHRRGVDLLFAVDTSRSMLTPDVKPNRLERAKLAVRDLVHKFPDDRVGLVAFAGSAFLETPLTLDHAIFEQSLGTLDTNVIPLGGTNVASAIDVADKALTDDTHQKMLVLLTDGEDLSGDALAAAENAHAHGLAIYTVGVGTPAGELIPLVAAGAKKAAPTFVKDEDGKFVTSKLDESLLRRIAAATGGAYRALGDNGQGLELLYQEDLANLPRSDLSARTEKVPLERFQWPLGLGLLMLALEPLIGERRSRARAGRRLFAWRHAPAAVAAAMFLVPMTAYASPQSAERAYAKGDFKAAEADYADAAKKRPEDARLSFNLGDSAYRGGDVDAASKSFENALHTSDLKLQEHAYYNLGDALYRSGQATLKGGKTDETLRQWKQAVSDYEAALHLEASDADATYNRDFVKRKIAELEKKKDDQKKQDDPKKQDDSRKPEPSKNGQGEPKDSKPGQGQSQPQQGQAQGQKPDQPAPGQGQGQKSGSKNPSGQEPSGPAQDTAAHGEHEDEAPSAPGELSKSEARALLDSLQGELRLRPNAIDTNKKAPDETPRKDW